MKFINKTSLLGYAVSLTFLGFLYGCNREPLLSKTELLIGGCYYHGKIVFADKKKAIKWWRKSAEHDSEMSQYAQYNLGSAYYIGDGVQEDKAEALKWYKRSSDQGYTKAQSTLGVLYYDGLFGAENKAEAVKLWQKAGSFGDAQSQYGLFLCYASGIGVEKNEETALKWLKKAADQNYEGATASLNRWNNQKSASSIRNVLSKNWQIEKEMDQGIDKYISTSHEKNADVDILVDLSRQLTNKARHIPMNDCPKDFAEAYYRYLGAWDSVSDGLAAHPVDQIGIIRDMKLFLQGMTQDFGGVLKDMNQSDNDRKKWRDNLLRVNTEMIKTRREVELLAVRYEAW